MKNTKILVFSGLVVMGGAAYGLTVGLESQTKAFLLGTLLTVLLVAVVGSFSTILVAVVLRNQPKARQQSEYQQPQAPIFMLSGQQPGQQPEYRTQPTMLDLKATKPVEFEEW